MKACLLCKLYCEFRGFRLKFAPYKNNQWGFDMTASAVLYAKTVANVFNISPAAVRSVHRRRGWWKRMSLRRTSEPTAFQKCLAVHLFVAERASALD